MDLYEQNLIDKINELADKKGALNLSRRIVLMQLLG